MPEIRRALAAAREETWAHQGEAARRIADYMINKRAALLQADAAEQEQA